LAPPFGLVQSALNFRKFNLPIVHDLCQASPGALAGFDRSALGDVAIFSFHPTKYICAAGGGAAIDFDGGRAASLRKIAKAFSQSASFNELHAAIGLAQIARLDSFQTTRAKIFDRFLAAAPTPSSAKLRASIDVGTGMMFRFPLTVTGDVKDRIAAFERRGIVVRHGVDRLSHRDASLDDAQFANAALALNKTLCIPFYPALSDSEIVRIERSLELLA
jgi:dTDP-4-amino-4,6-dideoxygalactose transaminase